MTEVRDPVQARMPFFPALQRPKAVFQMTHFLNLVQNLPHPLQDETKMHEIGRAHV